MTTSTTDNVILWTLQQRDLRLWGLHPHKSRRFRPTSVLEPSAAAIWDRRWPTFTIARDPKQPVFLNKWGRMLYGHTSPNPPHTPHQDSSGGEFRRGLFIL